MKNLTNFDSKNSKEFLDSFDIVLSDINGVLLNEIPIPNVKESIEKLKSIGKSIHYISNNSFPSIKEYTKLFSKFGVNLDQKDLVYPTITLIDYLKSIKFDKKVFCISGLHLQKLLNEAGIECVSGKDFCAQNVAAGLEEIIDDPEVGAVFIDIDININYIKICKAINMLKRPEVLYIVGAIDKHISLAPNVVILGSGAFIDIISRYSKRKPKVLGKPSEFLKDLVIKRFNIVDPKRVLFVGDTLELDMAFGSMCGFQKLLVLSGVTTLERALSESDCTLQPDYYIKTFGHLLQLL